MLLVHTLEDQDVDRPAGEAGFGCLEILREVREERSDLLGEDVAMNLSARVSASVVVASLDHLAFRHTEEERHTANEECADEEEEKSEETRGMMSGSITSL